MNLTCNNIDIVRCSSRLTGRESMPTYGSLSPISINKLTVDPNANYSNVFASPNRTYTFRFPTTSDLRSCFNSNFGSGSNDSIQSVKKSLVALLMVAPALTGVLIGVIYGWGSTVSIALSTSLVLVSIVFAISLLTPCSPEATMLSSYNIVSNVHRGGNAADSDVEQNIIAEENS